MIEIVNLSKSFVTEAGQLEALHDVNIKIEDGDIYGIIGMSGAGKSTLVRCINMLEKPTQGTVKINGVDLSTLSEKELRKTRQKVAMIFQNFNLLMQRNCLDNICFPLELAGVKKEEARARAAELLETVGLSEKAKAYPAQLSGGQQQRIAIARALSTNPEVLLCDEATSALDPNTTNSILDLIREINQKTGITVIVITHQMSVVENICNNVAILDNGCVVEEGKVEEVFSQPKTAAAKALVFPESKAEEYQTFENEEGLIRVVFNGATATREPLIARMAVEKGIVASIAYASCRSINEKVYGSMLLTIGDESRLQEAIDYLSENENVIASEVSVHVGND